MKPENDITLHGPSSSLFIDASTPFRPHLISSDVPRGGQYPYQVVSSKQSISCLHPEIFNRNNASTAGCREIHLSFSISTFLAAYHSGVVAIPAILSD